MAEKICNPNNGRSLLSASAFILSVAGFPVLGSEEFFSHAIEPHSAGPHVDILINASSALVSQVPVGSAACAVLATSTISMVGRAAIRISELIKETEVVVERSAI